MTTQIRLLLIPSISHQSQYKRPHTIPLQYTLSHSQSILPQKSSLWHYPQLSRLSRVSHQCFDTATSHEVTHRTQTSPSPQPHRPIPVNSVPCTLVHRRLHRFALNTGLSQPWSKNRIHLNKLSEPEPRRVGDCTSEIKSGSERVRGERRVAIDLARVANKPVAISVEQVAFRRN